MAVAEPLDVTEPVLEARELYRFHHAGDDETFALRGVSLAVDPQEMVVIAGPSGSGKSTLLTCLAGLDEPDGGHVVVAGHRLTRRPEVVRAALRARWIGMLLQSGNLIDHLSVIENVQAAQALVPDASRPTPQDLLAQVGMIERAHARPSTLSGGEAARVGLALALANDPPLLLADEPTGDVDQENEGILLGLLRQRAEDGRAVVVVSHSDRVAGAADRVIRLLDGRISNE